MSPAPPPLKKRKRPEADAFANAPLALDLSDLKIEEQKDTGTQDATDGEWLFKQDDVVIFDQSEDLQTLSKLDSYALFNLRLGGQTESWRTEIFVTNLFDEVADIFCCRYDYETTIARPRTIGARVIFDFN